MGRISLVTLIGPVSVEERGGNIVSVGWQNVEPENSDSPVLKQAVCQLNAYFARELTEFDLPLAPAGTSFQQRVWSTMCEIPHGDTWTYGELAARAGTAPRAVGGACGANPIPIIIPCHRVLSAGGSGGYSGRGGLKTKSTLLDIENRKARLL